MDTAVSQQHRSRGPRLYHKKSRLGCIRCKQRRVKCDEARPSCGGCSRHMVECVYPTQAAASTTSAKSRATGYPHAPLSASSSRPSRTIPSPPGLSPPTTENSTSHTPQSAHTDLSPTSPADDDPEDLDLPETRERRLWELRLLHNSLTMANPFPTPQTPELDRLFNIDIPNMAFKEGHDAILYGMLAHSALNMWTRSTDPKERDELIVLQQTYLGLLLREQRREVVKLNPQNADFLCISSLKILSHALALVQTLPLDPWEPPVEWLRMGRGAGAVFHTALEMLDRDDERHKIVTFIHSKPFLTNPEDTIYSDHSALAWLLDHPSPSSLEARSDTELSDPAVLSIYEQALGFTCSVQRAIDAGEPDWAICRRLGGFSVWIPGDFTQYLIERRPRAMVILAHFMALWLGYENIWVMGKAGERQIRGIQKSLPLEWSSKLDGLFARFKPPGGRMGVQGKG